MYLSPGASRGLHRGVVSGQVPGHLAHEPLEVLAAQPGPQVLLQAGVPGGQVAVLRPPLVDELGVLIHPHLRHTLQVLQVRGQPGQRSEVLPPEVRSECVCVCVCYPGQADSSWDLIRNVLPVDVTHSGAGDVLHQTPAHPHLEEDYWLVVYSSWLVVYSSWLVVSLP